MIMLAFNVKTVAIGAIVCVGVGAIGVKYMEYRIEKLKNRDFWIDQQNVKPIGPPPWITRVK